MATAGRGVRKATKLGGASEQDSAQSDTPQGPVDRITLVAQVTGWAPEECASVLEDYDGDEQAAISAIIEGTADAFKKVENKRTKPVEKPTKAPSYYKSSSDKSSRPPRADKNGEHTDTQRDGKPDRRRSANPKGDRPKRPFGKENGARPPAGKEDHTAPQPSGETAQPPTQTSAHTVNNTNPPSQPTAPTQTPPTESSNAAPAPAGSADTSNTLNKAPGSKPQRAWDQSRTWGAAPRSSSPSNQPRERNIPPRQQNQHTQQNATPQPTTETQTPAPTAVPEKAPAQSQAPAKPAQPATQHTAPTPSVAAVPTTQPKTPSPAPAAAPSPAAAAPTAPTQQTQPQQPQQTQAAQQAQSGSRYSAPRQNTKPGQTTTTWKPKETQPKAPSPQGGASQASQTAPAPAAVAPPQKPAVTQPVQQAPQTQAATPAVTNVHQAQAPAVSQARHTPVVLPPTADVTAANIHLQFGSISGLGSVPEVNKGVVDYESQQRYGSGAIGGSGQLGGEVYQDSHSVENDLANQQPHLPFPYHFGVGMPLQGLPPHYQPSFDPNDPEHIMSGMYQHPRDPADSKFPNRNSGSYGPRDANKFGQDAASTQAQPQPQPQQQGQQQQQSGQSPVQQHYMPVGQYGAGPMYYPYSYGPYQQPQYPPHFQRMLYKQPYGFPNANPGYPGPSTLGGYDENYKGSVYGAQMPPFMFPESNVPKVPSSQQAGLSTSPPKSAFSAGAGSAGSASDIQSGAFKSQAGDYKGYQNAGNNPQSFYNLAPAQSQFNQQQPISFGTPHNMLQQPQQPYQQQTRTSQQQY